MDGDLFRDIMNNDIGYTKKDRDKNADRMIKFAEHILKQNINIIFAANITSSKFRNIAKKNLRKNITKCL